MPDLDITGKTAVFGILSHPVAHVRTPMVMNEAFARLGLDAVMVPLDVAPKDLEAVIEGLRVTRNLNGLTVTVPHKVEMARLCDRVGESGRRVGAVNAVRFEADGALVGDNFDGQGYVAGMRAAGYDFKGKTVFQAGAGGAGMAIAFAVAEAGAASLTISNRTADRAEVLAERVRAEFPSCDVLGVEASVADPRFADLVINTTSLGLHDGDALPIDVARLNPAAAASEIIMIPEETELLRQAKARGHAVYYGKGMLDEQIKLIAKHMGVPLEAS